MKKVLLIIGMISLLSSCATMMVDGVSVNAYDKAIENAKRNYAEMGYMERGANKAVRTNVEAGEVVTHYNKGYTSSTQFIDNVPYIYETYYFQDSTGNELSFNTLLKPAEDNEILLGISLEGCVTSNYKDYAKLCGDISPIKRELSNIKPDTTCKMYTTICESRNDNSNNNSDTNMGVYDTNEISALVALVIVTGVALFVLL